MAVNFKDYVVNPAEEGLSGVRVFVNPSVSFLFDFEKAIAHESEIEGAIKTVLDAACASLGRSPGNYSLLTLGDVVYGSQEPKETILIMFGLGALLGIWELVPNPVRKDWSVEERIQWASDPDCKSLPYLRLFKSF